tara:strand:- start:67 stop:441 length:375 start_codon:yes stop_codon:yes gene_type:complete
MAATFSDYLLDLLLSELDGQANRFDICSQNPTNYAEATSTYTLGNSTSIQAGAPTDGDVSGRKVVFTAITDGTTTGSGTATHYGVSDTGAGRLLFSGTLTTQQPVIAGNAFTNPSFDFEIPDIA